MHLQLEFSFYLKRGIEFNKGWIIFGKGTHDQLPEMSCEVKLIIGNRTSANTYRFTNSGSNRKINAGNDLVNWISTLKDDDLVVVEILNKTEFKIYSATN